jgi:hypothetical protein
MIPLWCVNEANFYEGESIQCDDPQKIVVYNDRYWGFCVVICRNHWNEMAESIQKYKNYPTVTIGVWLL